MLSNISYQTENLIEKGEGVRDELDGLTNSSIHTHTHTHPLVTIEHKRERFIYFFHTCAERKKMSGLEVFKKISLFYFRTMLIDIHSP